MKNQIMTTIAALALFVTLAAGSAYAQSADRMKVTVPFDFTVSGKTFPAGEYVVRRGIQGPLVVLAIRSEAGKEAAYLATHTVQGGETQQQSKLVFNRYGDQYFLSQAWMWGRSYGDELPRTRRERLLLREIAKRRAKSETIDIAGELK